MHNADFIQGKLMGGYFDVDKIYYHEDNQAYYGVTLSDQFYSFGAGAAWGWSWYPLKTMVLSLSLGLQIFPFNVPRTYQEGYKNYTLQGESFTLFDIQPWYWGGLGSVFEIKFILGEYFKKTLFPYSYMFLISTHRFNIKFFKSFLLLQE